MRCPRWATRYRGISFTYMTACSPARLPVSIWYSTSPNEKAFTKLALRNLQRNDAIQPRVAGFVDLSHATRADGRDDLVGAESITGVQRHCSTSLTQAC